VSDVKPSLFLSYARADDHEEYDDPSKSFLRRLYDDLTARGYDVWWDRKKMPSRSLSFLKEIEYAINACDRLLLIIGPNALTSPYVQAEWQHAYNSCKPVIPLLREGKYDDVPAELHTFHTLDFCKDTHYANRLDDLLGVLDQEARLAKQHQVPVLPLFYVDRQNDIEQGIQHIRADLEDPTNLTNTQLLVTLHGMGGAGKSTVAAALAQDCRSRRTYPDGVFWLDMGKEPDLPLAMSHIGTSLGDSHDEYPTLEHARLRLSSVLEDKAALIVLDDVWDADVVRAFQFTGNHCCLLVTTRNEDIARNLGGHIQFMNVLSNEESLALLQKRVGEGVAKDDQNLKDIATLLENHTLAISVAAAKLTNRNPSFISKYVERLRTYHQSDKPLVKALHSDDKNTNLTASFLLSYEDFDARYQDRFRWLGVLPPNTRMYLPLIQQVWGDDDEFDVLDVLEYLEAQSLLSQDVDGDDLYRMHGIIRGHARALLDKHNEYTRYKTRYQVALFSMPTHDNTEATEIQFDATRRLKDDHPLLAEVSDLASAQTAWSAITGQLQARLTAADADMIATLQDAETIAKAQLSWAKYGAKYGWFTFAIQRGWIALSLTNTTDTKAACALLLGKSLSKTGQFMQALDLLKEAKAFAEEANDEDSLTDAINSLAVITAQTGDLAAAKTLFMESLEVARKMNSLQHQANALLNLGNVGYFMGEPDEAVHYYNKAAELFDEMGNAYGSASVLANSGLILRGQFKFVQAFETYQQAMEQSRDINQQLYGLVLNNLMDLTRAMGDLEAANAFALMASELGEKTASAVDDSRALLGQGVIALYREDYISARLNIEKAYKLMQEMEFLEDTGAVLTFLGRIHIHQKDYVQAIDTLNEGIQAWQTQSGLEFDTQIGMLTTYKALAHHNKGDIAEAQSLIQQVLDYIDAEGLHGFDEPAAIYVIAHTIFQQDDPARAEQLVKTGHTHLQEIAAQFVDADQKALYLQHIPGNRQLVALYNQIHSE